MSADTKNQLTDETVEFLRSTYLGPTNGPNECTNRQPNQTYLVGTLFPQQEIDDEAPEQSFEIPRDLDDELIDESTDPIIDLSNSWRPSSAAMSFIHDGASLKCDVTFGTYQEESETGALRSWRRSPWGSYDPELSPAKTDWEGPRSDFFDVRVTSKWRQLGENSWLVTVALQNARRIEGEPTDSVRTEDCLFQVGLTARSVGGKILPYRTTADLNPTDEESELALRFLKSQTYAVGHGTSVDWELDESGVLFVSINPLPTHTVPAVAAREAGDDKAFSLSFLESVEENPTDVLAALRRFVASYTEWSSKQKELADKLDGDYGSAAIRLVDRQMRAIDRMNEGVDLLSRNEKYRRAFSLAMKSMREQMLQSRYAAKYPGVEDRPIDFDQKNEPTWRPFQLGFILTSLASALDDSHPDRELVDLIWFPTGGGKTEAYLGLSAIVLWLRRITMGLRGGGTAVITRYTLRLLAAQQFQRAATLMCAMELIRLNDSRAATAAPFSIGLWVGNETTPGNSQQALDDLSDVIKMREPENPFQVTACPWCGQEMMPKHHVPDASVYGAKNVGGRFILYCPSQLCKFHERLPVEVVDEQLYENPPSILLGTVDKFARLIFEPRAGVFLGMRTNNRPPSLVIQDELHLLSGPLGTTVGIFETAIQGIMSIGGNRPKIVASTATIKSADEQVRGLLGADVALFPPSGLDEADSYFAITDETKPGRRYIGLMPQSFTQSTSVVQALTALLEVPFVQSNRSAAAMDAYWTVVAYHNSLRELGRTVTIVQDDIRSRLVTRASGSEDARRLAANGLIELTGQVPPSDLSKSLDRLSLSRDHAAAVDVVASTNMLSVGIDVPRLATMLMNGQPKTTAEYIQATSRVGRGDNPGIIVTLYRSSRPRDRSHYEQFNAYHQSLYRHVEPTSVTPWSPASRRRTLASVLVAMYRQLSASSENEGAQSFRRDEKLVDRITEIIRTTVSGSDPSELDSTISQLNSLIGQWDTRATEEAELVYSKSSREKKLLKSFVETGPGWSVINSMRNVDAATGFRVYGEKEHKQ